MSESNHRKARLGKCDPVPISQRRRYLPVFCLLGVHIFIHVCICFGAPSEGESATGLAPARPGFVLFVGARSLPWTENGTSGFLFSHSVGSPLASLDRRVGAGRGVRTERRVTQQLKLAGKGLAGDLAAELPKNPASSFMKPLPSFHRELAPGNSATRASSSVEGQRKETSDSEDAFKRQRAVHVLEAAFAQLSHFHPDAYETANVRGLTKWWEDPYIFIFLCMSFAALIAMGVWCIVASYK